MSRLHLRRPSPGLIVAAVALFIAMGGGAYAATSSDKKTDKKIAKKAAKNYFNGHIGGASVSHANTANSANSATNATKLGGAAPSEYQTASNYTQSSTAKAINATAATIGSPIQVTTTGTKRLIASAAVHATNGVPNVGVYLVCHITIDGTSGVNDTDYAAATGQTFNIVDASVSPLASAVVGAGTHTVTLLCQAVGGGSPSANVVDDALAGWAVSS